MGGIFITYFTNIWQHFYFLGMILSYQRQFQSIRKNPVNQGLAILSILLVIISILANNSWSLFWVYLILFPILLCLRG